MKGKGSGNGSRRRWGKPGDGLSRRRSQFGEAGNEEGWTDVAGCGRMCWPVSTGVRAKVIGVDGSIGSKGG